MEQITLEARVRSERTKGERNRIRREGGMLANLYGKTVEATPIYLTPSAYKTLLQHGVSGLVHLNVEGKGTFAAIVHEVERDPLSRKILHIDFHAVNMDEKVDVEVPLVLEGVEAVEKRGGVIQQQLQEILLRALPQDIPEQISVNISGMKIGDSLHVGEISIPERCTLKSDAEQIIVTIIAPKNADLDTVTETKEEESAQES